MYLNTVDIIKTSIRYCSFGALAVLAYAHQNAHAQIFESQKKTFDLPVEERIEKDLVAPGYYAGPFIVHPKITLEGKYDSNIFAQQTNESDDFSISVKPSINVLKEIRDHVFSLEANAEVNQFLEETNENNENYDVSFKGKVVGNSRWQFPLSFFHRKKVRQREKPLVTRTPNERLDTKYTTFDAGVTRKFNRLNITLLGNYATLKYEDGLALDGINPTIYSDNNRQRYGGLLRFRYDLPRSARGTDSEHILFTNLTYNKNEYDKRDYTGGSFSGPLADNDEYGFLTGLITNYKGLLFANIGAGVTHQSFDNSILKDRNTTEISAFVNYNFTPKLTFNLKAQRENDPDNGLAEGVLTSAYSFGADYELQHNLYLGGELSYTNYDFESLNRKDDDYLGSLYLKYQNSRNIESMLRLNYRDRQSNTPDREFDRLELIFSLIGKI